ncbi:MAG TPA: MscL family protein [Methanomicrobiales archaeon]|nr:MscL family protein [Methanomicrobiales archaeon]
MGLMQDFYEFLMEYKVVALAIAFIMGVAANQLIKSLVDNIIMPLINPILASAGTQWQTATLAVGPFVFGWGPFLSDVIYFIIIAFVIFLIAKVVLKQEKVKKI